MAKSLSGRRSKVWLFYRYHLRDALSLNIIREICLYIADFSGVLAHITATSMRLFDCHSLTWAPQVMLQTSIRANEESSWVILEDGCLFCSGGGYSKCQTARVWKEAYLLSPEGEVEGLPWMISARCWHGVIALHHSVYIFGGAGKVNTDKCTIHTGDCNNNTVAGMRYSALRESEKIELSSARAWVDLPDMREKRSHFNPCQFDEFIYLCGCGSGLVEAFIPLSNLYLPLPLSFPEGASHCSLYVDNNLLVVHSYQHISKFAKGRAGQLELRSQLHFQTSVNKWSNSQLVLDPARTRFFIFQQDKCLCLHMETGAMMQSFL